MLIMLPFLFCGRPFRALDVDVDNPHTGRASLVAIAKAAGVTAPLVNYEQVSKLCSISQMLPESLFCATDVIDASGCDRKFRGGLLA